MTNRRVAGERSRVRRVNAPVRRAPRAGSVPDVLIAAAFGGWAMAVVLVGASFLSETVTAGEAGPGLARILAGMIAFAALLVFLLGLAMLRETQFIGLRIGYAFLVGALGGSAEALLLLELAGFWMLAPLALVVLMVRPVRERLLVNLGLQPRGDGLQ